ALGSSGMAARRPNDLLRSIAQWSLDSSRNDGGGTPGCNERVVDEPATLRGRRRPPVHVEHLERAAHGLGIRRTRRAPEPRREQRHGTVEPARRPKIERFRERTWEERREQLVS
ncbi:MAG: hypothetical protein DIU78_019555, partial [Pseudomonadota bacterium]